MSALALPTARDEAWRYSDLKALARAHALPAANDAPVAARFLLAACEQRRLPLAGQGGASRDTIQVEVPVGAAATLVEPLSGSGWLDRRLTVRLGVGATLDHLVEQSADAGAVVTSRTRVELAAGAQYRGVALNFGGALGRLELTAVLNGADAHASFSATQLGGGAQTLEIVTRFDHAAPGARSSQLVRSVLGDRATGSYLGQIHVARDAQQTDAAQSSKALLLSRAATANTKPELLIFADDVKCAHGATVGELDRMALFYLESRGLSPEAARALLIEAFVADVIAAIADPDLREPAQSATGRRLADLLEIGR